MLPLEDFLRMELFADIGFQVLQVVILLVASLIINTFIQGARSCGRTYI